VGELHLDRAERAVMREGMADGSSPNRELEERLRRKSSRILEICGGVL
jgi:hypothetical protein